MDPRPALENLCCLNVECKTYGQRGANNLTIRKIYGADRIRYLRCRQCGEEFSERKGTALFNSKISEAKAVSVIEHLDSACGLNTTARRAGVARDTVRRLVQVGGRVRRQVHDQRIRQLTPHALQFDEKWAYVGKKQRQIGDDDDPLAVGDYWAVNALDPHTKVLVTLVPGKRTTATIHQAVADAQARLAPKAALPALFTDGEPAYVEAIRQALGRRYRAVPALGPRATTGPDPAHAAHLGLCADHQTSAEGMGPQDRNPTDLWQRKAGRGGHALGVDEGQHQCHGTLQFDRPAAQRPQNPKTMCFSRRIPFHDAMSYNFHHPHRALRQRIEESRWRKRTPAMAAGIADHIYSSLELMRLCPVGLG